MTVGSILEHHPVEKQQRLIKMYKSDSCVIIIQTHLIKRHIHKQFLNEPTRRQTKFIQGHEMSNLRVQTQILECIRKFLFETRKCETSIFLF